MARNTKALELAVSMMLLINLYECLYLGPIDGYKFPVYTTASCPQNKTEWLRRSFVLNCTDQNGYMCIPNEMITELVEFCYTKDVVSIPKGICLFLDTSSSAVNGYHCHNFSYGCPSYQYFSNRIFEHQSCVSIIGGCFLADPYCERKTTTSKYNTEEGGEGSTGRVSDSTTELLILNCIRYISQEGLRVGGKWSTGGVSDPTTELLILDSIQYLSLEGLLVDVTEFSLNENSNQGPLTDRASFQTTELLIPDNIQDMPLEGPRAGGEMSSFNRNANPRPLTNCASDSTTELLIPNNKQDIPLEGPHAGGKESSLNRNSNPGPLMDRASDQTTELLILDNIQDLSFEGPCVGVEESSLNENSNPRPLPDRACVQTSELLIPDNIQDILLEGPRADMLRA